MPLCLAAEREGLFRYRVYVAEYGGAVAGFVAFSAEELAWLYVDPALARRGIGSRLAAFALGQMEGRATVEVLLGNAPALALYARLGFVPLAVQAGVMPGNEAFPVQVHVLGRGR